MFKKRFFLLIISMVLLVGFFAGVVSAVNAGSFIEGLGDTARGTGHAQLSVFRLGDLPGAIGEIIGIFLSLLGVIFLILMIYGGYIWMMARGNEQDIEKAKNILKNAIIGLIVVLAAYAITAFVGASLKDLSQ